MSQEIKYDLLESQLREGVELALEEYKDSDGLECWNVLQNKIAELLETEDPKEFLTWFPYRRAIFVGNSKHIPFKLKFLRDEGRWKFWDQMLEDSGVGNPDRLPYYKKSTGSMVNNAYHLEKFFQVTGKDVWEYDNIFEFGAGYGAMCNLVHKVGFTDRYFIYDLPITLMFQRYYLAQHIDPRANDVWFTADMDDYLSTVTDRELGSKIFIGMMSFSEAPLRIRAPFYNRSSHFDAWMLAYAEEFAGLDNGLYFKGYVSMFKENGYEVWEDDVDQRPGKKYLFAWRNNG